MSVPDNVWGRQCLKTLAEEDPANSAQEDDNELADPSEEPIAPATSSTTFSGADHSTVRGSSFNAISASGTIRFPPSTNVYEGPRTMASVPSAQAVLTDHEDLLAPFFEALNRRQVRHQLRKYKLETVDGDIPYFSPAHMRSAQSDRSSPSPSVATTDVMQDILNERSRRTSYSSFYVTRRSSPASAPRRRLSSNVARGTRTPPLRTPSLPPEVLNTVDSELSWLVDAQRVGEGQSKEMGAATTTSFIEMPKRRLSFTPRMSNIPEGFVLNITHQREVIGLARRAPLPPSPLGSSPFEPNFGEGPALQLSVENLHGCDDDQLHPRPDAPQSLLALDPAVRSLPQTSGSKNDSSSTSGFRLREKLRETSKKYLLDGRDVEPARLSAGWSLAMEHERSMLRLVNESRAGLTRLTERASDVAASLLCIPHS
ncbi:hypothetical protein BD626DRAFT_26053 [Schizophyllum amplum]|uniref:Uncharacterized protein n=1 Tax=Schizophyllum amplum TaxID=97359 RepID=A0A550CZN4_9AGAR|nr:hypothetical protein BD626DRAFT_26053 [Auriculariopsis ampla]